MVLVRLFFISFSSWMCGFSWELSCLTPPCACHCGSSNISLISKTVTGLCRLWPVTKHNMVMLSLKGWDSWKRLTGNFISIRDDGDAGGRTHSLLVPPGRERTRQSADTSSRASLTSHGKSAPLLGYRTWGWLLCHPELSAAYRQGVNSLHLFH